MATVIKSEWHTVEKRYALVFTEELLAEIYSDTSEEEISELYEHLANGNADLEEVVEDAMYANVDLDWEWLDQDDWVSDRKGGYPVEYSIDENSTYEESDDEDDTVEVEDDEGNEVERETEPRSTVAWPFAERPSSETVPTTQSSSEEDSGPVSLQPCTQTGEYRISIYSRGIEAGIGTITQEQYEYWEENPDGLADALNLDAPEDVPENARFTKYYNDYNDIVGACGPDESNSTIVITAPDGTVIFSGDTYEFFNEENGTEDNLSEFGEYYIYDQKPGYYVYWAQGGKGEYFTGTFTADGFDPTLLKFQYEDVEGNSIINCVEYGDEVVDDEGGNWWGKWADYQVHKVE